VSPRRSWPASGFFLADDHAEHRGLARAVGADDPADPARGQGEREVVDQQLIAERLAHAIGLDHDVAQTRPRRDVDLVGLVAGLEFL